MDHKRKLKIQNWVAKCVIKLVSFVVVFSVAGIFFNLVWVVWPIFQPSQQKQTAVLQLEKAPQNSNFAPVMSFLTGDAFLNLDQDGSALIYNVQNASLVQRLSLTQNIPLLSAEAQSDGKLVLFLQNGTGKILQIHPEQETTKFQVEVLKDFSFNPEGFLFGSARLQENQFRLLFLNRKGKLTFSQESTRIKFTGAVEQITSQLSAHTFLLNPTQFDLDERGEKLLLANESGYMEVWELGEQQLSLIGSEAITLEPITSAQFLYGGESYVLTTQKNALLVMNRQRTEQQGSLSFKIRQSIYEPTYLQNLTTAQKHRVIGLQNKANYYFFYASTGSELLEIPVRSDVVRVVLDSALQKVAFLDALGKVSIVDFNIPFPELGFATYFRQIFYEGYAEPAFVWQSSSGNEDYEVKLSFVPLIIGSLKGTLYALLFSFPLAVFGAIYLSQFARPAVRKFCKPMVEILATVPSVVIGFLAAMWLGPYFEMYFLAFCLFLFIFPLVTYIFFRAISFVVERRITFFQFIGWEFLVALLPFSGSLFLANFFAEKLETTYFPDGFTSSMVQFLGVQYEQQNAMVTAFALGLATIPIIFTITEDSMRSVPETLRAASLALGASKWQTVMLIIVPSASAGIFAALMLGASRAVGETMIVLMASGNTPINSMSLLNGMRTLAANIAVEIVEAPVNGSLYRTLFLTGLVLFTFTFIVNVSAELVRSRLRKKLQIR